MKNFVKKRKFNGKTFYLATKLISKKEAIRFKQLFKENGAKVRIISYNHSYLVYVRFE